MIDAAKVLTAGGRYPRGEETKQRIIAVAVDIFGRQGFAGTSTRDIAAAASVNTPAIQYYFVSKFGLYRACIDQLTDRVSKRIDQPIHACQSSLDTDAPLADIITALSDVQTALIDAFFADAEGQAIRRLLAWEDAENGEKTSDHLMKDRIGLPIFQTFRNVVERVTAVPMQQIEIEMHALSLMGISMIFHFNQSRVMDMLKWESIDDGILSAIKDVAHKQLTFALIGLNHSGQL